MENRAILRRKRSQSGSAIIEFGLTLPVFLLVVFGFVQFSLVFFGYCSATYATQAAVRYAVIHGSTSSSPASPNVISTLASQYLWTVPRSTVTVTTSWSPNNNTGSTVTVAVTMLYTTPIPFSNIRSVPVGTSAQGTILF